MEDAKPPTGKKEEAPKIKKITQKFVDEAGKTPQRVADEANASFKLLSPSTQVIMTQFEFAIRKAHVNRVMDDEITTEKDIRKPGGRMSWYGGFHVCNSADFIKECIFTAVKLTELDDIERFLLGVAREKFSYTGIGIILTPTPHTYNVFSGITPSLYCNIDVKIINKSAVINYTKHVLVATEDCMTFDKPADKPNVVTSHPPTLATLLSSRGSAPNPGSSENK